MKGTDSTNRNTKPARLIRLTGTMGWHLFDDGPNLAHLRPKHVAFGARRQSSA
jgi:hypothetical protein